MCLIVNCYQQRAIECAQTFISIQNLRLIVITMINLQKATTCFYQSNQSTLLYCNNDQEKKEIN